MPIKSPFFERTARLCHSMNYKEWAGYYAVSSYLTQHDPEYFALRLSAGLIDITPLFKYNVTGRDAAAFLSRIMVRDISKLKIGKVAYCCWCTDRGKVIDDGTVMRRSENEFFVTSADPSLSWFSRFLRGYDVKLEEVSFKVAGLALQGPVSRQILKQICDADLDTLKYFQTTHSKVDNFNIHISRTGFTGDLGYELWVDNKNALTLYDRILNAGRNYNIRPAGLDALDITRIEAGLILKDVDYYNALHTLIEGRKSSPYELNLGWTVDLDRSPFMGQEALRNEYKNGSDWTIVGLDINWDETEALYSKYGLPPEVGNMAWRTSIPVYSDKSKSRQIGYATSGTWSPVLKKNIALTTLEKKFEDIGSEIEIEYTVEHTRYSVRAIIRKAQFFNPERKKSNPLQKVLS